MNIPTLSICIPTYNRAKFLDDAIESVVSQINVDIQNRIEICISDNASVDDTKEIIEKWKKNSPVPIVYHKNEVNIGGDLNFLQVVKLAKGSYCWFLGDDDVLRMGSIERILKEIEDGYDIYLYNRIEHFLNSNLKKERYWLPKIKNDTVFNLSNKSELLDYMNKSVSIGALFSFISSIIFDRKKWMNVKYEDTFTGTGYAHVFMLLSFINQGCRLKYIKEPLVICRLGNSSFADEGDYVNRTMLDINGYNFLAERFFSNDLELKKAFLEVLKRERPYMHIIGVRIRTNKNEWMSIEKTLRECNYNKSILILIRYTKVIFKCIWILKNIFRSFLNSSRAYRKT